jgi:hypothetical protein
MEIDKELEFSDAQAVTASAASTNHIDLGAARSVGVSSKLFAVVTVTTELDSAAEGASLQVQLQCDDNSGFASAKTVLESEVVAEAALVAGYQIVLPIPPNMDERYVRLNYAVTGENFTSGAVHAAIVRDYPKTKAYPNAI